jgi:S1-C subfamily serine protease
VGQNEVVSAAKSLVTIHLSLSLIHEILLGRLGEQRASIDSDANELLKSVLSEFFHQPAQERHHTATRHRLENGLLVTLFSVSFPIYDDSERLGSSPARIDGLAFLFGQWRGNLVTRTQFLQYQGPSIVQGSGGTKRTINGIDIWENGEPNCRYRILGLIQDDISENQGAQPGTLNILNVATASSLAGREKRLVDEAKKHGADGIIYLAGKREFVNAGQYETNFRNQAKVAAVQYIREANSGLGDPHDAQRSQPAPRRSGTGFFISEDGYLVTNEHVVKDSSQVRLGTPDGLILAKVVKVDATNDFAILKAEGKFFALPVASSRSVKLGATVATVGFPNIVLQGFAPKLAKGEIGSLAGIQDDPKYFQISTPIQPGNSGGALVDERGNVIGVVVGKLSQGAALLTSGELAENVNYAVKGSFLLSFLESMPNVAAMLKEPTARDRKFEDVVNATERATVLVLVY